MACDLERLGHFTPVSLCALLEMGLVEAVKGINKAKKMCLCINLTLQSRRTEVGVIIWDSDL